MDEEKEKLIAYLKKAIAIISIGKRDEDFIYTARDYIRKIQNVN